MKRFISPCSPLSNISPDSRSAILFTTLFYAVLLPPCLSSSAKIFTTSGNANNNAISRRSRYFVSIDEKIPCLSLGEWIYIYIYIDNIFVSRLNSKKWFVRLHFFNFGFVKENRLTIFVVPRHIYTSIPLLYVADGIVVYTIPTNNGCYMLILQSRYEERILIFWMIQ